MPPKLLADFAFSSKRDLIQYSMEDEERVAELLMQFMGVDAEARREFVKEDSSERE
jgi:DNA gyrase/topoisomerase IV subunit B